MKLSYPTFYQVFCFLQTCNSVTCSWPLNADVGKLIFVLREICYNFTIFNIIIMIMTLIYAIHKYCHDVMIIMKNLAQIAFLMHLLVNLFICRWKNVPIQHILTKIKNFLLTSKDHEKIILQKYINRYAFFSTTVIICYFSAIIIFCGIPIFTSKKFPSDGLYPFSTESPLVTFIIYISHTYIGIQWVLCVSVDFMFAVFFLYSAARLEMLCLEIEAVKNERHMILCIKKHQEIIKFVDETRDVVQYSLFMTNIIMAISAICATFPFIYRQSLGTFQFMVLVIIGCQRLYITASPADNLKENSKQIGIAAYNMLWIGKSRSFIRNIHFMIQRSQKPLVINMGSILPTLSLKYYAKYLMTILTYFMTMRAIIDLNH